MAWKRRSWNFQHISVSWHLYWTLVGHNFWKIATSCKRWKRTWKTQLYKLEKFWKAFILFGHVSHTVFRVPIMFSKDILLYRCSTCCLVENIWVMEKKSCLKQLFTPDDTIHSTIFENFNQNVFAELKGTRPIVVAYSWWQNKIWDWSTPQRVQRTKKDNSVYSLATNVHKLLIRQNILLFTVKQTVGLCLEKYTLWHSSSDDSVIQPVPLCSLIRVLATIEAFI